MGTKENIHQNQAIELNLRPEHSRKMLEKIVHWVSDSTASLIVLDQNGKTTAYSDSTQFLNHLSLHQQDLKNVAGFILSGRDSTLIKQIQQLMPATPLLAVGEGFHALITAFGGTLKPNPPNLKGQIHPLHGCTLFINIPLTVNSKIDRTQTVELHHLPAALRVTAIDNLGAVIAVQHQSAPYFAIDFTPHPVRRPYEKAILTNFIDFCYLETHHAQRIDQQTYVA